MATMLATTHLGLVAVAKLGKRPLCGGKMPIVGPFRQAGPMQKWRIVLINNTIVSTTLETNDVAWLPGPHSALTVWLQHVAKQ
jgi:hypothetical protein